MPMMVIAFVTSINILGVDWLMRFETFLGVMAALPCLVFLGFGIPHIKLAPNLDSGGDMVLASMVSRSLWLYGGFTNLGVLAGECKTPRKSWVDLPLLPQPRLFFTCCVARMLVSVVPCAVRCHMARRVRYLD